MGYSRTVYYASAVAALALLTGCNPLVRQDEAEQIAERRAEAALSRAYARIAELEAKLEQIEPRLAYLEEVGKINSKAIDSVSSTVSHNAKVANENALKDMTATGACGRERVDYPDGSWSVRNRKCTRDDMKR